MSNPRLEWRARRLDSGQWEIVLAGPRGAVRDVLLQTPKPDDEWVALTAAAAPQMFAALESIEKKLLAGQTVTIAPYTREHVEIGMALAKARGKR